MPMRPVTKDRLQALAVGELILFAVALVIQFLPSRTDPSSFRVPHSIQSWVVSALLLTLAVNAFLIVVIALTTFVSKATGKWDETTDD